MEISCTGTVKLYRSGDWVRAPSIFCTAARVARGPLSGSSTYVRDGAKNKFSFAAIGQLAANGRRTGVANILGLKLLRIPCLVVVTDHLPRFEKKLRVALDWTLDLVFSKDLVQFLTIRAPVMSGEEEDHEVVPGAQATGGAKWKVISFGRGHLPNPGALP